MGRTTMASTDRAQYEKQIRAVADTVARTTGVPADLLHSAVMVLAQKESGFNPKAEGSKLADGTRAQGMLQYTPAAAKDRGIDPFNVVQAATAAAHDAAKAYKRGGVAEIAASHFAGAGGSGRGPKTREYVRDFLGKMAEMGSPAHRFTPDRTQPRGRMNASADPSTAPSAIQSAADPTNPFSAMAAAPATPVEPEANPFAAAAPDAQALPDGMQEQMSAQNEQAAPTGADPMEQYAAPALTAPKLARLDTNPFGGYDAKRDPTTLKWFESMIENADG